MRKKKKHFYIPNTEIFSEDVKRKAIPKPKENFNHKKHSQHLIAGIEDLSKEGEKEFYNDISVKRAVFKVELDENQKIERRGNYERIFVDNSLKVRALRSPSEAIVSTDIDNIKRLRKKIEVYGNEQKNSQCGIWDYVKNVSSFSAKDKIDDAFLEKQDKNKLLSINVTVFPLWDKNDNKRFINNFKKEINKIYSKQSELKVIFLSDETISAHLFLPSSELIKFANQNFVMSIEKVNNYSSNTSGNRIIKITDNAKINPKLKGNIDNLPVVGIIDDGIMLPDELGVMVKEVYKFPDSIPENNRLFADHGTKVASRCIFGEHLINQQNKGFFSPKVQVIDIRIMHRDITEQEIVEKLRKAVLELHNICSTFIMAWNANNCFDTNKVSLVGAEIDNLIYKYGVNFIIPTGNHNLYQDYSDLKEILSDKESKISPPADGLLVTSVGAIQNNKNVSSFSRVGMGFNNSLKPGLVEHGGNEPLKNSNHGDETVEVIDKEGYINYDKGTSFSAPLIASDFAIAEQYCFNNFIANEITDKRRVAAFEAKALLYHSASNALNPNGVDKIVGFGMPNLDAALYSYSDNATYIRYGELKRKEKLTIAFNVPGVLNNIKKRGKKSLRIIVTVIDFPTSKRISGKDYLDGYINTNLSTLNSKGNFVNNNPKHLLGRKKWYNIHHFTKELSTYNTGDWKLQLEYFSKPNISDDSKIEYVVVISIEDLTGNNIDIYGSIDATNRFVLNIQNINKIEGMKYEQQ